jgi:diacylglycerol kinase family enzyme
MKLMIAKPKNIFLNESDNKNVLSMENGPNAPSLQHFQVRRVEIATNPAMPVMADGIALGDGLVVVGIKPQALAVMVGQLINEVKEPGENN